MPARQTLAKKLAFSAGKVAKVTNESIVAVIVAAKIAISVITAMTSFKLFVQFFNFDVQVGFSL